MKIEMRDIAQIKPYENNPRFNDAAVEAVARSIQEFGFRQPIVVDENNVIIVGHTRYKAALKLGLKKVPVHLAKGLTPAQARAYRLADNQTATLPNWNEDLLPIELASLQEMDFDLDLKNHRGTVAASGAAPAARWRQRGIGRRHALSRLRLAAQHHGSSRGHRFQRGRRSLIGPP